MRRETLLAIWVGGFVLAAALYLIGPDRFFDACLNLVNSVDDAIRNLVAVVGGQTYGVIRALAIAIYIVFALLAFLASQRGHRGIGALVVVTIAYLILVWRPYSYYPTPVGRWMAALAIVAVGAVIMTQRLMVLPSRREMPPPPYPPGGRV